MTPLVSFNMADHNVPKHPDHIVFLSCASGRNCTRSRGAGCALKSLVCFDFRDQDGLQFEVVVLGEGDAIHLLCVVQLELPDRHLRAMMLKGATTKQTVLGTKLQVSGQITYVKHKIFKIVISQNLQACKKTLCKTLRATRKCSNIPKNC